MIKLNREKLIQTLIFASILIQLNQRPAILQSQGTILFILSGSTLLAAFLIGHKSILNRQKKVYLIFSWFVILYLAFSSAYIGQSSIYPALVNILLVSVSAAGVLLITDRSWKSVLAAFTYPTIALSLSYAVTVVLAFGGSFSLPDLEWLKFYLAQGGDPKRYVVTVYFPFSVAVGYQNVALLGSDFARATGYFREPGIFQIVVVMSYFALEYIDVKYIKTLRVLIVLTLILTFSTAGIACFLLSLFYYYVISKNKIKYKRWYVSIISKFSYLAIIGYLTYLFVTAEEKFGLLEKLSGTSGGVRLDHSLEGVTALVNNPLFGVGYMNPDLSSITFLAMAGQIGIVGIILVLLVSFVPLTNMILRRDPRLVFIIPVVLTAIFGQPLFDRPIYYLSIALVCAAPPLSGERKTYR